MADNKNNQNQFQNLNEVLQKTFVTVRAGLNNYVKKIVCAGDLQIGLKDRKFPSKGIILPSRDAPSPTTDKLYNENGTLKFDGGPIQGSLQLVTTTHGFTPATVATYYIPFYGVTASTTITDVQVSMLAPFDGTLQKVIAMMAAAHFPVDIGLHLDQDTTAVAIFTGERLPANVAVTFDFTTKASNSFTAGQKIEVSLKASRGSVAHVTCIWEYNTST